ncbi:MAG: putative drug exporter of the superfamily, partial [Mycobacterium sp.]|nr:putative drug exporter of the superfamily [Mycobacterium sp.]
MSDTTSEHSKIAQFIRRLAVPVILGWLALTVITNVAVPPLETVGEEHTVSMNAKDAPSMMSMQKIGATFHEFSSDSNAMIILEGDQPLGADAHHFYDELIKKLEADTTHVEHIQDFWGDPLTAAGAQSNDGKSAYVQVYLHGNMGETLANDSVKSVQAIVANTPPPPGVKAYVTGGAPLVSDQSAAGNTSILIVTIITLVVIALMLVLVYRSFVTMIMVLLMVFAELGAARGIVAFLGYHEIIGLSTFATSLLTLMVIAAGTDYAIFLIGRYQEARGAGEDREQSYYSMFHGTAHVVLGSGLTIAGAMLCLSFTRLPYFQTLGVPCAVGTLVAVLAALTLGPAVIAVGSRFRRMFEPRRAVSSQGWRRIGTVIVRWPAPILVATIALALVGLLALPSYKTSYDNRLYLPKDMPANVGYQVADAHFNAARMNPELLMIESDHDLRTSADFLVIDKIAKAIFHTPGISRVQTITRPDGKPIKHSTIPFQISMQGTSSQMNQKYLQDTFANMLKQADDMQTMIDTLTHMLALMDELSANIHDMARKVTDLTNTVYDLRDHIADFDDWFRP